MKNSTFGLKVLFSFIFVFLFSVIFIFLREDKNDRIETIQQNKIKNIRTIYKFMMHDFKLAADARYEKIQNDKKIISILKKAANLPVEKQAKLRQELYVYLEPMFYRLKYIGLTNLHFVFEDNKTFLRMHKPNKYGDDLSKYRYTFKYVNDFREPISGYEQGRTKHGFRYVYPIYDRRGEYLGAIDFTFSSVYLQKVLADSLGIYTHFLIDKKILNLKAWKDGDVGYDYKTSIESENFSIVSNSSLNDLKENTQHLVLTKKIRQKIRDKLKSRKDFSIYIIKNKNVLLLTFLSIQNVKDKKTIAYLVAYTKDKTIYDIIKRYKILLFVLFVMLSVILYFQYKLLIGKNLLEKEVQKQIRYIQELHESYDKNIIASSVDIDGKIVYVSEAFCDIFGYSKEELIGKTHRIFRCKDDKKSVYKRLYMAISKGEVWKDRIKTKNKKGDVFWFDTVVSPIFDSKKNIVGYSIIGHDVTSKKNLEELNRTLEEKISQEVENIREKDKQLIRQSRLAQMGEMISMIAHQWRQPLSAISSTSSVIVLKARLKKLDLDMTIELAEKISHYVQHLSSTINDFREFFKPNKEKKVVMYSALVESVLSIVEDSISNKNIKLIKDFDCKCEVETYANEIKQVILNLIKNAEDILIEKEVKNPYIKVTTYSQDDKVILEVSDNGGGIPESLIDRIFDPYFSTKSKKDGTGLGLYMSKTIIEEHCGGKLNAFNSQEGAVFEIILYESSKDPDEISAKLD